MNAIAVIEGVVLKSGDEVLVRAVIKEHHGDVMVMKVETPHGTTHFAISAKNLVGKYTV